MQLPCHMPKHMSCSEPEELQKQPFSSRAARKSPVVCLAGLPLYHCELPPRSSVRDLPPGAPDDRAIPRFRRSSTVPGASYCRLRSVTSACASRSPSKFSARYPRRFLQRTSPVKLLHACPNSPLKTEPHACYLLISHVSSSAAMDSAVLCRNPAIACFSPCALIRVLGYGTYERPLCRF
jgi:hypothetical protein